ncbi:MAG: hypothetical protein J5I47_09375 [Vicingus serpentipes]|nr:hypothetical protein [Vicingus serpentipes]
MKKLTIIIATSVFTIIANELFAQSTANTTPQEVTKTVSYNESKGVKLLTITSTVDGKTTTETFKGKEAEQKMKEMEATRNESANVTKVEADGKKIITIEEKKTVTKEK